MDNSNINWFLEGDPCIQFVTRIELLGQPKQEAEAQKVYRSMISHPLVSSLLHSLENWPEAIMNSHKNADHPLHKLVFLADIGLRPVEPVIAETIRKIFRDQDATGAFQVVMNIKPAYGGTGTDILAWALCDAPSIIYVLQKFGFEQDERVQKSIAFLSGFIRENGWPCTVSADLGKFRGPGRKSDPCPYATLLMLKVMAMSDQWRNSDSARMGAESILSMWTESRNSHPYMFYMGTDFRKAKAPFIWYDLVHVVDVLSQFHWILADPRFIEMTNLLFSKKDNSGRYTPESVWLS